MSMKSFDKFCEKIILGEPGSEKEIFDERQKLQRLHLTVEALVVYGALSAVAVMLNETANPYCDSSFMLMVICMAAGYLWWVIRSAAKGCLFGVSGKGTFTGAIILLCDVGCLLMYAEPFSGSMVWLTSRGMSDSLAVMIAGVLIAISSLIIFVMWAREKKLKKEDGRN